MADEGRTMESIQKTYLARCGLKMENFVQRYTKGAKMAAVAGGGMSAAKRRSNYLC
jgi:hypothetical protein